MGAGGVAMDPDQLGSLLLESRQHVNHLVPLLRLLRDPASTRPWHSAAASLLLFFRKALDAREFTPGASGARNSAAAEAQEAAGAEAVFQRWLQSRYAAYLDALLGTLGEEHASVGQKRVCVEHALELVRRERPGQLSTRLLSRLLHCLGQEDSLDPAVAAKLLDAAASHWDLCVATLQCLHKTCSGSSSPHPSSKSTTTTGTVEAPAPSAQGVLALLHPLSVRLAQSLPPAGPRAAQKPAVKRLQAGASATGEDDLEGPLGGLDSDSDAEPAQGQRGGADASSSAALLQQEWALPGAKPSPTAEAAGPSRPSPPGGAGKRKRAEEPKAGNSQVKERARDVRRRLGACWTAYLRQELPTSAVKAVLTKVHDVIPLLPSPLLLADFLTQAYTLGGSMAVRALGALFRLMTEHSLEYPKYYQRLYALLEPAVFLARHRSRFVELVDASLASPLIPSYIAAAFAKRLARLAVTCPTPGCVTVIPLLHNLLRRHPSINTLVQHPIGTQASTQGASDSDDEDGDQAHASGEAEGMKAGPAEVAPGNEARRETRVAAGREAGVHPPRPGVDPYKPWEAELEKCGALGSSLWELEALRCHFAPAVSRFAGALEADLTQRRRTADMRMEDFSAASYSTVFGEEMGRRVKSVALAYHTATPSALFPQHATGDTSDGITGKGLFYGWAV